MSELIDEAHVFAKALELGLSDVAEVVAWADARLLREDRPPVMLCDASLARGRDPQDVAAILRHCPGTPNESEVGRLLTAFLRDRLRAYPGEVGRIAEILYRLAIAEAIESPRLSEVALWAWDALDLAEAGYIDMTHEQIVHIIEHTLDEAAGNSTIWPHKIVKDESDSAST